MAQADAGAECLTSPTNMLSLLWQATDSSALVADVLNFSWWLFIFPSAPRLHSFRYWSTFQRRTCRWRHLLLMWRLIPVCLIWGYEIPCSISNGGMFGAFIVRTGQVESCITQKWCHSKIRLNNTAFLLPQSAVTIFWQFAAFLAFVYACIVPALLPP